MTPVTQPVMNTDAIKADVEKNFQKLTGLREEVRMKLHLASMDAKQEWDDKIAPHVLEAETAAKAFSDSSRSKIEQAILKVELFLENIREKAAP